MKSKYLNYYKGNTDGFKYSRNDLQHSVGYMRLYNAYSIRISIHILTDNIWVLVQYGFRCPLIAYNAISPRGEELSLKNADSISAAQSKINKPKHLRRIILMANTGYKLTVKEAFLMIKDLITGYLMAGSFYSIFVLIFLKSSLDDGHVTAIGVFIFFFICATCFALFWTLNGAAMREAYRQMRETNQRKS